MQLISGKPFWPLDPRPEEIQIEDIAWALAMQCRYAGHVLKRYSVAEHSVMVSCAVPPRHALWGLLHDATEAYLVDLPRPVKRNMPDYREAEDRLGQVIAERFNLRWPMPPEVKQVDAGMLLVERSQLLAPPQREWDYPQGGHYDGVLPDVGVLPCWDPEEARAAFLDQYHELVGSIR